jgi:hypothetical protein
MGLFRKREKVVDWTERLTKQQESTARLRQSMKENTTTEQTPQTTQKESSGGSFFSFFGNSNPSPSTNTESSSSYGDEDNDDRKKKLAKRLSDMTIKLEDLSNSIYKIEQRLELIERKMNLGKY